VNPANDISSESILKDFPTLKRRFDGKRLVYLDSAATSLKPESVIEAVADFYRNHNANIHRGVYRLSQEATALYEETRKKLKRFFNVPEDGEIVYTKGTTEAINLVVISWARKFLKRGDTILLSQLEHHSNMVPWQLVARERDARILYIPIDDRGNLDMDFFLNAIKGGVRLVSVNHISNVLGTMNPVEEIAKVAHENGALVLIDGAQSAPHIPVDLRAIGADFYAVSGHKMLGPTGTGFLYAKKSLLKEMDPYQAGGDMIREVTLEGATWNEIPYKFEAGTQNIAGIVGLGAAVDYLETIGMERIREHGERLALETRRRISEIEGVRLFGSDDSSPGGVVSFNVGDIHAHDVGTILDSYGVAIRTGHHCAQPLMERLGVPATARASFHIYNIESDIESLYNGLKKVTEVFGKWS